MQTDSSGWHTSPFYYSSSISCPLRPLLNLKPSLYSPHAPMVISIPLVEERACQLIICYATVTREHHLEANAPTGTSFSCVLPDARCARVQMCLLLLLLLLALLHAGALLQAQNAP